MAALALRRKLEEEEAEEARKDAEEGQAGGAVQVCVWGEGGK